MRSPPIGVLRRTNPGCSETTRPCAHPAPSAPGESRQPPLQLGERQDLLENEARKSHGDLREIARYVRIQER
jgi:hypothetical protein